MKKGRHRRYEEARKFKRSYEDDLQGLIETFNENESEDVCDSEDDYVKPEHASWAAEFEHEKTLRQKTLQQDGRVPAQDVRQEEV